MAGVEHEQYLGVLHLLGRCAEFVPEDLRAIIGFAMDDACEDNPSLAWKSVLNRIELNIVPHDHIEELLKDGGPGCMDED